jgi:hypothetical protein
LRFAADRLVVAFFPGDVLAPALFAGEDVRAGARLSASSIHTGAWSLAPSRPRASRSTFADFNRVARDGLSRK